MEGPRAVTVARRKRTLGTAFAELALTLSLIVSILFVLTAVSATRVLAATRSELIVMEESSSPLTTIGIVSIIVLVMGVLTILALRDVAPVHSKRTARRPSGQPRR